jgi:hypothetical protein
MNPIRNILLLTFLLTFILLWFFPWWIVTIIGLISGAVSKSGPWQTFVVVATGAGMAWLLAALWVTQTNSTVLLPRIAEMFFLPSTSLVFALTALIAAIPSGLAAMGIIYLKREALT